MEDSQDYLTDAGVTQTDQVAIWNLRGYRLPRSSDVVTEIWPRLVEPEPSRSPLGD